MLSDNKLIKFLEEKNKITKEYKSDVKEGWDTIKNNIIDINKASGLPVSASKLQSINRSIVPSNFKFSRNAKANVDIGVIKSKVIFNLEMGDKERFSYLSLLNDHISSLEIFTGVSSKAIAIKNVKLMWSKAAFNSADGYVFYKYCPKKENVSCSSPINYIPKSEDLGNDDIITTREFSNMVFYTYSSNGFDIHSFTNDFDELKNMMGDFYLNPTNPYLKEEITNLADYSNINEIAKGKPSGELYNYVTLNLSHTDNDILLSKFKGKTNEFFSSPTTPKLEFEIEITVEDYIQNLLETDFNTVLLREFLVTKRKKFLNACYNFAATCDKIRLKDIIRDLLNNLKINSYGITVFKSWLSCYKSLINISLHGLTISTISKFKKLYDLGKLYRPKDQDPVIVGVMSNLINGVDLKAFDEINSNLISKKYDNFDDFFGDITNVKAYGRLPLYLGDDYRYISNIVSNIIDLKNKIYQINSIEDDQERFLAKQRATKIGVPIKTNDKDYNKQLEVKIDTRGNAKFVNKIFDYDNSKGKIGNADDFKKMKFKPKTIDEEARELRLNNDEIDELFNNQMDELNNIEDEEGEGEEELQPEKIEEMYQKELDEIKKREELVKAKFLMEIKKKELPPPKKKELSLPKKIIKPFNKQKITSFSRQRPIKEEAKEIDMDIVNERIEVK